MSKPGSRWHTAVGIVAVLCSVAMVAVGALIWSHHRNALRHQQDRAEFAAAAEQVAVTLMSVDFDDPQTGVQRILDNAVDPFRSEFQSTTADFVRLSEDAKVTTKAVANAAAVQSISGDTAVVLVVTTSTVMTAEGVAEAPRSWQLKLDLRRDGDRIKMSEVEFLQ